MAYPLYALSGPLLIDFRRSALGAYVALCAILLWLAIAFTATYTQRDVSVTAFLLELVLLTPLLLFISGFSLAVRPVDCLWSLRFVNLACFVFSVINLVRNGFPLALPYLDYLPDEYFGTFGIGGARIVTIFGFTGLLMEASMRSASRYSNVFLLVAFCNFVVPSYILGIVCGLAAFALIVIRRPGVLLLAGLLLIPAALYALDRLGRVNSIIAQTVGWHPKVYAHILVYKVFSADAFTTLLGTGVGQFTSTPQIWASEAFRSISAQSAPNLPGLSSSYFHLTHVEPVSSLAYETKWALSSALNKPYTGATTALIEMGAFSLVLAYLFCKRALHICTRSPMALVFFAFFISLNLVDQWLDNLWLGYCLLLTAAFFSDRARA